MHIIVIMEEMMNKDILKVLVDEKQLDEITTKLAKKIDADYFDNSEHVILLAILKGSVVFMGDLMKKLQTPVEIEFMKVSSYGAKTVSSGYINIHLDIKRDDMAGVDFIIIEDIVDSGNTLSHLVRYLSERGAASVKTCTLLDKPDRRTVDFKPDYSGKVIPDKFVVGFGLDYNELYRNLPYIGVLRKEVYSE